MRIPSTQEAAEAGKRSKTSRDDRGSSSASAPSRSSSGAGKMTGDEAAESLNSYWKHLPNEAVHATFGHMDENSPRSKHLDGIVTTRNRGADGSNSKDEPKAHAKRSGGGLPKGWHKGLDSENRVYYYDTRTGQSSWDPPPGTVLATGSAKQHRSHDSHRDEREGVHVGGHVSHVGHHARRDAAADHGEKKRQAEEKREEGGGGERGMTGSEARSDFDGFLQGLVTSAKRAHDAAERDMQRRRGSRGRQFVDGKMTSRQAAKVGLLTTLRLCVFLCVEILKLTILARVGIGELLE